MENKDELKEIDIKNYTYYYFDNIIRDLDISLDTIFLDKKSYKNKYKNILIYDISYNFLSFHNFISSIPLCIRINKIDGFINI